MYVIGHKHSKETKKKIAQSHLGLKPWNKGKISKEGKLSLAEYYLLLNKQKGVCAICGKPETQKSNKKYGTIDRLRVDHNHQTGKVRGLLYSRCNFGLGHFKDNFDFLLFAANYLMINDEVDFTTKNRGIYARI